MTIADIREAIVRQIEIDTFLVANGMKDLVGDYGEALAHMALGGKREPPTTKGHDITHPEYRRIQVKTRRYERKLTGGFRKEDRAVGFDPAEPNQFEWLCHISLDINYHLVGATLARYEEVWPEILKKSNKVRFSVSSALPSSVDITQKIRVAEERLWREGYAQQHNKAIHATCEDARA